MLVAWLLLLPVFASERKTGGASADVQWRSSCRGKQRRRKEKKMKKKKKMKK
jgi:hypothetical protein